MTRGVHSVHWAIGDELRVSVHQIAHFLTLSLAPSSLLTAK